MKSIAAGPLRVRVSARQIDLQKLSRGNLWASQHLDASPGPLGKEISAFLQKNPRVRKIRVRNSGARNGCANFMDA